jgi:hypothetical protein
MGIVEGSFDLPYNIVCRGHRYNVSVSLNSIVDMIIYITRIGAVCTAIGTVQ